MQIVFEGHAEVRRDSDLVAILQTCAGIVLYDNNGNVGIGHAVVPKDLRSTHVKEYPESHYLALTPEESVIATHRKLKENGANPDNITAAIFGCRNEELGRKNYKEATMALQKRKIPISYDAANSIFDTRINIAEHGIGVTLLTQDTSNEVTQKILAYRTL